MAMFIFSQSLVLLWLTVSTVWSLKKLSAVQAACGRWLCDTNALMEADRQHEPVGSTKHCVHKPQLQCIHIHHLSYIHLEDLAPPHSFPHDWLQKV